jgi:hypothetical protein
MVANRSERSLNDAYVILPDDIDALLTRLATRLALPLVSLPAGPLSLGDALEDFRFYDFSVRSLSPNHFQVELNQALRTIVEGELMAREAMRRKLDRRPDVLRDLNLWTNAWRAHLLAERVAGEARVSDDDAFRELALTDPERAREDSEVSVEEILSDSRADAESLRVSIARGGDFAALARRRSRRAAWASNGGRSGYFEVHAHPNLGYAALLSPSDSLFGPIQVPEGFSLYRVLGEPLIADSGAARARLEHARSTSARRKRSDQVSSFVASLAARSRVEMNYPALRRVSIFPSNMVTKRMLGFGGGMLAAPSLPPLSGWVQQWRSSYPPRP